MGMVESRRKASDASGAAGSQQGCSDNRPQGRLSQAQRRVMACIVKIQGNRSTSLSTLIEQDGKQRVEYLPFDRLILLVHWSALTAGHNTRESVKLLSYQPVGASMMSVNAALMSGQCTGFFFWTMLRSS